MFTGCTNDYLVFFKQKKEETERNPKGEKGIHPNYRISRDTLCYSVSSFHSIVEMSILCNICTP